MDPRKQPEMTGIDGFFPMPFFPCPLKKGQREQNGNIDSLLAPRGKDSSPSPGLVRISDIDDMKPLPFDPQYSFDENIQKFLTGRQLLPDEIPFSIDEIHEHVLHGYIVYRKGIIHDGKNYRCARCGNDNAYLFARFLCVRCGKECTYCRKCIMMGRVSQCTPLLSWTGPAPLFSYTNALHWKGTLHRPSRRLPTIKEAVQNGKDLLIWAVCGAGKPRCFLKELKKRCALKRTAIATPRTDVILNDPA